MGVYFGLVFFALFLFFFEVVFGFFLFFVVAIFGVEEAGEDIDELGGDGDAGEFFDEVGADLIGGASDFERERGLVVFGGGEIGFEEIGELTEERFGDDELGGDIDFFVEADGTLVGGDVEIWGVEF